MNHYVNYPLMPQKSNQTQPLFFPIERKERKKNREKREKEREVSERERKKEKMKNINK